MAFVYIVEDDKNIREIEVIALKNSGYEVQEFETAGEFRKAFEERQPDLLLLDLMLPDAYPISATIAVVRNLTELKGSGMFTLLPETSVIAMASPIALPTPRTTAVMIPDFAAGRITLKIVCIWDAPSASDADFREGCTARIADSLMLITVGRIIMASTITADSRFAPPVN